VTDRVNTHASWRLAGARASEDHEAFRETVAKFFAREMAPHEEEWRKAGRVDKAIFSIAGSAGLLGLGVPEDQGGSGTEDFRYNAIFREEAARAGISVSAARIAVVNDVCIPYFLSSPEPLRTRWLPKICDGSVVTAIAMTEPGAGSDLVGMQTRAIRQGDHFVVTGVKTMISNAGNADLAVVACKTGSAARRAGISLLLIEMAAAGVSRGAPLKKAGQPSSDLGELIFEEVKVPVGNLLGAEGTGFAQLVANLPRERLSIAIDAVYQAEAAFEATLEYATQRRVFNQPVATFQANRFTLAEMRTELDIARNFIDAQIGAINRGILSAEAAAQAKWWCTELCTRVVDRCLQLHGGYGYMDEYPISRLWRDTRAMTLYGGTTEVMKEIIGRGLGIR